MIVSVATYETIEVSVLLITFNHEAYIRQSLESVISQQFSKAWEIVVCDDCSTDKTFAILSEYRQLPHTRIVRNKINSGLAKNLENGLSLCKGKYIALLEGDDYWTDPLKLERQVQFLDKNIHCTICCHAIKMVDQDGHLLRKSTEGASEICLYKMDQLLEGNFIRNCSVMYRRIPLSPFPDWFFTLPTCDFPLHIFHSMHGDIGVLPQQMAAYRIHPNSIYSSKGAIHDFLFREKFYALIDKILDKKYANICKKQYFSAIYSQVAFYLANRELRSARVSLGKLFGISYPLIRTPFLLKGLIRYAVGLMFAFRVD